MPEKTEKTLAMRPVKQAFPESEVRLTATGLVDPDDWYYAWRVVDEDKEPAGEIIRRDDRGRSVIWSVPAEPGRYTVEFFAIREGIDVTRYHSDGIETLKLSDEIDWTGVKTDTIEVEPRKEADVRITEPVPVSLERPGIIDTPGMALNPVIRASVQALAFENYFAWMDSICGNPELFRERLGRYVRNAAPYADMISYKALKLATEAFLMANVGVHPARGDLTPFDEQHTHRRSLGREQFSGLSGEELDDRLGLDAGDKLDRLWRRYLDEGIEVQDADGSRIETLPYLALVRNQLPEWRIEFRKEAEEEVELCDRLMGRKFTSPTFLELIWSYWHEEGMLCQTIGAVAMRFQNRGTGQRDPLMEMTIDPLRPLNNLLWGYVQDEQHRLTLPRRLAEYDQEYGLTLFGRAIPPFQTADPRSRFLEAFHTLLHRASIFYKEDDDTTMIADPFPVLNALRDVHLVLAEGANNSFGGLPWTARHEMLIQQWLLARPEFRDFLPSRVMVVNPEPWMDRVDAMKRLQGWGETPVRYFRDLARFGEMILLSIRFGNWGDITNREEAGNWARYWREEVQWYMHAYETVTGVDLSADTYDVRHAQLPPDRFTQPAFLLRQRMVEQRRRLPAGTLARPYHRPRLPRQIRREAEAESEYQG